MFWETARLNDQPKRSVVRFFFQLNESEAKKIQSNKNTSFYWKKVDDDWEERRKTEEEERKKWLKRKKKDERRRKKKDDDWEERRKKDDDWEERLHPTVTWTWFNRSVNIRSCSHVVRSRIDPMNTDTLVKQQNSYRHLFFGFDHIVFFLICRPLTKRRRESNPGRLGRASSVLCRPPTVSPLFCPVYPLGR